MKPAGGRYSLGEIQRIRDHTRISDIIGRFVTWDTKKTNPGKGDWWACCPFHGEKNPSFHCEDAKGRYHCFGCGESGDVFRFLQERAGLSFRQALDELGGRPDEIRDDPRARRRQEEERARRIEADRRAAAEKNESVRDAAHRIWRESIPIAGTLAAAYLAGRGADGPFDFPTLRFHPALKHPEGPPSPALVAAVQGPDDRFLGVWRIYLDAEGRKRSDVANAKLGLGAYTDAGGGVRLGAPHGLVNVAEGIENGFGVLGILRVTGRPGPVLCGLNTTGMAALEPPADTSRFLIWPDGDVDKIRAVKRAGVLAERKIESPGLKAARLLAARLEPKDFPCAIQPTSTHGRDYLDTFNRMNRALHNG